MKVLMMLSIDKGGNPYKRLLVQSLVNVGVEVAFPEKGRFAIWKTVRKVRPDAIHLHWQHGFLLGATLVRSVIRSAEFFVQLFALRLLGTPVVWTVHNIVNHENRLAGWELAMSRVLARSASLLIVHCSRAVAEVAGAYKISTDRIRVVPHGHFGDAYPPPLDQRAARERMGIDPEAQVLLFFGQIRRYKGISALLNAFKGLVSERLRLIIAGQPKPAALGAELQTEASKDDRVITELGFIPDDLLIVNISACDVVVLPYKDALTSGAAILAATYGKPIVAPRLGCMRDFPDDAGLFYDPNSPGGLKNALERLEGASLGNMGRIAETFVRSNPWSVVAALTVRVYMEASEGRG